MSLDLAIRLTEIMLGFAFLQQSIEHLSAARDEQRLFLTRAALSILLVMGFQPQWISLALIVLGVLILILCCLCLALFIPALQWRECIFGYLAIQVILSYFIAGWVKIVNPAWRNGRALQDVFLFSAYPVSESLRRLADWPRLLFLMSWAVMLFEMLFPLALTTHTTLIVGLVIASLFHLANAVLFGLNRFFWIWLAAYPSIIWLQHRVFG